MKKLIQIVMISSPLWGLGGFAQNTKVMDSPSGTVISSIGGTDIPYSSSILDIRSTTKAVLLPRMPTASRDAITSPIAGMLLYNNTTNQFNYHDGTAWQQATFGNQWNVSGLNYYYNGGNVGIGDSTPDYKLDVLGTTYTSDLIVGDNTSSYSIDNSYFSGYEGTFSHRIKLNNPSQNSVLSIKGDDFNFGSWGQHIILENADNTNYGGILHDTDGMKFRNFGASDNFYFRNSANTTVASIDPSGNTAVEGTLTVNNGKGVAYNPSSATNLKIVPFTTGTFVAVLGPHDISAEGSIGIPGGFTSTPKVFVGDIDVTGGTSGELYMVELQLYGCTPTSCKARLVNRSAGSVNYSITWNCVAIGN